MSEVKNAPLIYLAAFLLTLPFLSNQAQSETIVLKQGLNGYTGVRDSSIFEDQINNGAGGFPYIFVGNTNNSVRRALIRFELPEGLSGDQISTATLVLQIDRAGPGAEDTDIYKFFRLTNDWGEADTQPEGSIGVGSPAEDGDVTWLSAFHNSTQWSGAGGDFENTSSDTIVIPRDTFGDDEANRIEISTPALTEDVKSWADSPQNNFGWIITGEDNNTQSARRFDSKETTEGTGPELILELDPSAQTIGWTLR